MQALMYSMLLIYSHICASHKSRLKDTTFFADISLAIELQQGYYSIEEDGGFVQVCVEVESGDISGRSISINYTTVGGSAQGRILTVLKHFQQMPDDKSLL